MYKLPLKQPKACQMSSLLTDPYTGMNKKHLVSRWMDWNWIWKRHSAAYLRKTTQFNRTSDAFGSKLGYQYQCVSKCLLPSRYDICWQRQTAARLNHLPLSCLSLWSERLLRAKPRMLEALISKSMTQADVATIRRVRCGPVYCVTLSLSTLMSLRLI